MAVSKGFELASLASNLDTSQVDGEVITINMDTDVVGEGSTNLYFTNERVDDRVSSLLVEGSNISLTYNDTAGTLTVALDITGGLDLSNNSTADLSEDPAATTTSGTMYYTDTRVQTYLSGGTASSIETTGNIIVGGNLTVNGSTTTINSTELAVDDLNITIASGAADSAAANGAGITVDGASATITYATSGDKWVFNKVPYYNTLRLLTTTDLTGSDNYAFKTITDGSNAAVANSNTGTFTITATDQIEATVGVATDTLTIGHATSGVTAAQYGSSIAIPVITIDAEGHITAATTSTVSTSWTLSDSVTTQSISAGDTLTVIDGTDINVVVGATDTLTVNNTSTLQTVTGRGNATTNSIGIGTSSVTSGYSLDIFGKTLAQDAVYIQDTVFTTAYDSITGLVVDSSHIDGTSAGYGNSITFTKRASTAHKKAAISLYQPNTDPDVSNLRFFVSPSATATDPVTLSLELMSGGQVKISDAYTLPLTDGAVNQALITNGSGAISFTTLDSVLNWNVATNYAFKTVVAGGTSLVADSNTDTLTISAAQLDSIDGIVIVGTVGTDTLTIAHANTSSVADLSGTANTFISAQTYDTYGHVLSRTASAVDFDVSGNYAYKFMSDGSNISSAASNTDTFTFINGTDTTAVVDSANDTVKFNNTSTLDSVTGRGNTTTNSITVNNAIVNGNLTVNGTTTIIDTTNLLIEDAIIVLNKNSVSAPANDIGFLLQRYSTASAANYNVAIAWNETDDRLVFGETIEDGTDNALSVSSEWMTITNTGNVGIGTSSPSEMLTVTGGNIQVDPWGRKIGYKVSGNSNAGYLVPYDTSGYTSLVNERSTGAILFKTGLALDERVRIDSSGNVGIGTTAPSAKLEVSAVNGIIQATGTTGWSGFSATKTNGNIIFGLDDGVTFGEADGSAIIRNATGKGLYYKNSTTTRFVIDPLGNIGLSTTPARLFSNRAGIQLGGSVGAISATNGLELGLNFYVAETSATDKYLQNGYAYKFAGDAGVGDLVFSTAGNNTSGAGTNLTWSEKFRITTAGNVGIGTSSPTARLQLSSTGNPGLVFDGTNQATDLKRIRIVTQVVAAGDFAIQSMNDAGSVKSTNLYINASGNVGIGTSTPTSSLHIRTATNTSSTATGTTLLTLENYVGSDINQQKTFIDFTLFDDNTNETPQVRIGAEVGQNGDANTQEKEGSGAFVVYTNNADTAAGDAGASLAERFRVDYTGNVGIGTSTPATLAHVYSPSQDGGKLLIQSGTLVSNNRAALFMSSQNVNGHTGNVSIECIHPNNQQSDLVIRTGATDATSFGTERLRVTTTGNVGIGTGQLNLSRANDTSTGGGQIYLNGATGNRIDFNSPGVAAPTFTTRSAGTKIVLYPTLTTVASDYALGIDNGTLWSSVPETQYGFKWYGGTTLAMTLSGTGNLTAVGSVTAASFSGALSGNATTATTLATPRAIEVSGAVTGTANFDGSAAINIVTTNTADPTLTLAGDLSGSATFTNLGNATLTATLTSNNFQKKTIVQDAAPSGTTGDFWYESDTTVLHVYYNGAWIDTAPGLQTSDNLQINSLGVGTAASGVAGEIRATNDVVAYYSDARLKNFEGKIDSALDKVKQLNGYYFTENETAKKLGYANDKRQVGVSAQEVEAVLPEIVTEAPISNEYLTVKYEKLAPLFIEAIKEIDEKYQAKYIQQQAQIDMLLEEINKLIH